MVSFTREVLCEVVQEIQPLLEMHYDELCLNRDRVALDPQWDQYLLLERLGRLAIFTARDDGRLVGYSAFFVQQHMHYAGLLTAQNDVFYLVQEHRRGTTALRFLRYTEQALKDLGAHKVIYHCKLSNQFAPILHRLGFADEEVMVGKML